VIREPTIGLPRERKDERRGWIACGGEVTGSRVIAEDEDERT
jgi:hypothetical protein